MKSTAERLVESYCVPTTDEEWKLLSVRKHSFNRNNTCVIMGNKFPIGWIDKSAELNGFTEITASQFIDLVHDRIVPWRLEEDGFEKENDCNGFTLERKGCKILIGIFLDGSVVVNLGVEYSVVNTTVTTYTQLLTLIELIG